MVTNEVTVVAFRLFGFVVIIKYVTKTNDNERTVPFLLLKGFDSLRPLLHSSKKTSYAVSFWTGPEDWELEANVFSCCQETNLLQ